MIKEFAWDIFKNTGNVDAYLMMRECEKTEQPNSKKDEEILGEIDGNNKN